MRAALLLITAVWSLSCGSTSVTPDGGPVNVQPTAAVLFKAGSAVKKVVVEIDYTPDAAPYTGSAGAFGDTFALFVNNAQRLFKDSGKALTLPTQLAEMEAISQRPPTQLTVQQLLDLAAAHRGTPSTGETASFYVLFVDAKFQDDQGVRDDVLGVSIGTTGVIAMFKPVINSTRSVLAPNLVRFVEQTTLIHELGHAVGLVNNGAPLSSQHHDATHGAHCSNSACVMYWQNEGASAAADFARRYVLSGSSIVFADDCLADVDALK